MKKILVLGGGFGGIETFIRLKKHFGKEVGQSIQLEMINRTNFFTFTPMLHEAATGAVSREHVVQPLREILGTKGSDFHEDTVEKIDVRNKTVYTTQRAHTFDYLVIALGVEQGFFNVPGAREYAVPLKWLPDAIMVRNRIIDSFEKASESFDVKDNDAMKHQLHFVIVGGGPTGTELAGQMSDLISHDMHRLYPDVAKKWVNITLVHAGPRLLEQLSEKGSREALDHLENLGTNVLLNDVVTEITPDTVKLKSGKTLQSTNVYWTGGTQSDMASKLPAEFLNERGLIKVTPQFHLPRYPYVFAIGDCTTALDPAFKYPPTAQAAVQEARIAAQNIAASIKGKPFIQKPYFHKGDIIPLANMFAIYERSGLYSSGRLAWLLRRGVFLQTMYSWSKRMKVVSDWLVDITQPRDTAEF